MSATYTPGPWRAHHDHGWLVVESDNGDFYLKISRGSCTQEHIAEAHLIAATPDLLEAVRAILFQVIQGPVLERDACIAQARTAYVKAIGAADNNVTSTPDRAACTACDCTGDVHSIDGEWRGECPHCRPTAEMRAEIERLRLVAHRLATAVHPNKTHEEIAAEIERATGGEANA